MYVRFNSLEFPEPWWDTGGRSKRCSARQAWRTRAAHPSQHLNLGLWLALYQPAAGSHPLITPTPTSLREGRPGTEPRLKVPPLAPPRTPGPAFTGLPVAQAQKLLCVEAAARRAGWVGAQALGSLQSLRLRCVFAWTARLPSRRTSLGKEVSRVPSRPHSQGRRAATGPSLGGCGKSRGRGGSQAKFSLLADAGSLVPSHSTLLTWSASVTWEREPNCGFLATPNIRLGSILLESTSGFRTSASHFTSIQFHVSNEDDDSDDKRSWEKVLEGFEPGYLKGRCLRFLFSCRRIAAQNLKEQYLDTGCL